MGWQEYTGSALALSDSPSESERFGLSVARVVLPEQIVPTDASAELGAWLDAHGPDVVVARHLAGHRTAPGVLAATGWLVLPAGTLTYWEVDAAAAPPAPVGAAGLTVVPAAEHPGAADVLREVVEDSFAGYGNHYSVDPLLDDDLALQGYVEWAVGSLRSGRVLLLLDDATPVGAATLAVADDGSEVEVLLAGLVGAAQGRGSYGVLLDAARQEAGRLGAARLVISTQAHNVRVQRAWARLGLKPFAAVETSHLVSPSRRDRLVEAALAR